MSSKEHKKIPHPFIYNNNTETLHRHTHRDTDTDTFLVSAAYTIPSTTNTCHVHIIISNS